MKVLLRLLILLGAPLLILAGLYGWVVLRSPAPDSGPLVRTSERKVVWEGDPLSVRLHFNGDRTPSPPSEPEGKAHYATDLVIDHSASMGEGEGSPLEAAIQAASYFARVVGSPADPVGAVAFDDTAGTVHPVGPNGEACADAILNISPGGGTDIAVAVEHSHQELKAALASGSFKGAKGLMVVLSDGGSDRDAALQAAAQAKADGIRIVTIGLGSEVDEELLRSMATTPADFRQTLDAGSLGDVFTEIAGEMATVLGHAATLTEPYHYGAFSLEQPPPGFQVQLDPDQGRLKVSLPVLFLQRVSFPYKVRARKAGLFSLALDRAELTYLPDPADPANVKKLVSNETPPVLVLSPLLLALLYLPSLGYVVWRLWLFLRRPKPIRVEAPVPVRRPEPPQPLQLPPKTDPGPRIPQPTLFIGLGEAGRNVLTAVAEQLGRDRYLDGIDPLPFRFLQVDGRKTPPPATSDPRLVAEKAQLPSNMASEVESLAFRPLPSHLRWLQTASLRRAEGAELDLTMGSHGSRWVPRYALFHAFERRDPAFLDKWRRAVAWLGDQGAARVVVVGAMESGTGGLLSDIGYLLHTALPGAIRARIPIYACTLVDVPTDHPQAAVNQWAFLRELDRELLAARLPQPRVYDPGAGGTESYLNDRMESPAYAGVFLLQAPDDDRPEAQESFITRVATLGHTLTEQSLAQETQRYLDEVRPLEQKLESEFLEGAVHSAAVYSIRFPVAELQSRLADRFVLEVIGSRLVGVNMTAGGAGSLPTFTPQHLQEAAQLLSELSSPGERLYQAFGQAAVDGRPETVAATLRSEAAKAGGDVGQASLAAAAAHWFGLFLNGLPALEADEAEQWRLHRIALLHGLVTKLTAFGDAAARLPGIEKDPGVQETLAEIRRVHRHFLSQVDGWLGALVAASLAPAGVGAARVEGLCRRAQARREKVKDRLAREAAQPWQFVLGDGVGHPSYDEDALVRDRLEPFLERERGFLPRTVWEIADTGPGDLPEIRLQVIALRNRIYRATPEEMDELLAELRAVAQISLRELGSVTIFDKLRSVQGELDLGPLARLVTDQDLTGGLELERHARSRSSRQVLVLVPGLESQRRQELEKALERMSRWPARLVEHRDLHLVRLVVFDSAIPLGAVRPRRLTRERGQVRDGAAFIFLPEREGERLRELVEERLGVVPCPELHPFTRLLVSGALTLGDLAALAAENAIVRDFATGRETVVVTDGDRSEAALAPHQTPSLPRALLNLSYGVRGQGTLRSVLDRFQARAPLERLAALEAGVGRWQEWLDAAPEGPEREVLGQLLLLVRLEVDLERERQKTAREVVS
jgi:hypothetical protein